MNPLHIVIPGPPVPKGRPRAQRRKDGTGNVYMFTPRKTVLYEKDVKFAAMAAMQEWKVVNGRHWPVDARFKIEMWLFMEDRRRRDLDNCVKAITDGLNTVAYKDDSMIDDLRAVRDYDKTNPRAIVVVRVLGT